MMRMMKLGGLLAGAALALGAGACAVEVGEGEPLEGDEIEATTQALLGPDQFTIAVFDVFNGIWGVDLSGNGDLEENEIGAQFAMGRPGDIPISYTWAASTYPCTGNTTPTVLAFWRPSTGKFYIDANNNKVWDGSLSGDLLLEGGFAKPGSLDNTIPFVRQVEVSPGNCRSQIGIRRAIGLSDSVTWYFDANFDGKLNQAAGDTKNTTFGQWGDVPVPVRYGTGNTSKLAVYRGSDGSWFIDANGNGVLDACNVDRCVPAGAFGSSNERPFVSPRARYLATSVDESEFIDANVSYQWDGPVADSQQHVGNGFTVRLLGIYH